MINRPEYVNKIKQLLSSNPVVALIGARQVGKTFLAKLLAAEYEVVTFFDLENPESLSRLADPLLALRDLQGLVIIDEIQLCPDLFKVLRVLADRQPLPCRFLVLGSASPTLLRCSSESLAGRIAYLEIQGFSLAEVGVENLDKLWVRGSFPRAFLAETEEESVVWRQNFIRTFLERDLPQLGIRIPALTMRRFWMMLAHYHGQIWNASSFAASFGVSDKTIRHYLDILVGTFIVRQLPPWWENIAKRQVKAPKIYLRDSGILHTLLQLNNKDELEGHPKIGASWEGFAIDTVLTAFASQPEEAFFWHAHSGAELDLLLFQRNKRLGFEFKRTTMPKLSSKMLNIMADLHLSHLYVVHAGLETYPLAEGVTALSLPALLILPLKFN